MSKLQTQPLEDFIARARTAKSKQEKQLVLSIQDADRLASSLSQVMTRLLTVQEDIIEALKTAQQAQTVNIEMDGGNFSAKK